MIQKIKRSMFTIDQNIINKSTIMSPLASTQTQNEEKDILIISLSSYNSEGGLDLLYDFAFTIFTIIGCIVNYKLYDNARKGNHGEAGSVLQWIMKTYAMIQGVTSPFMWVLQESLLATARYNFSFLHPCVILNSSHLLLFCTFLLQFYFGIISLVLAIGRYAFVVHSGRITRFGVKRMGNILIWSSFVIPLFMTLLVSAVLSIEYNGLMAPLKFYELSCSFPESKEFKVNTTITCYNCYRSPIYNLANSYLPSSAIESMLVFLVIAYFILYCNITEGIVYFKSVIFVFR